MSGHAVDRSTWAGDEWTKARYFQFVRDQLRKGTMLYPPLVRIALERVRRKANNPARPRLKWEFQCDTCKGWFARDHVEVDHKTPVGSCNNFDDLPQYVSRLYCEPDDLAVLCFDCHDAKTGRKKRRLTPQQKRQRRQTRKANKTGKRKAKPKIPNKLRQPSFAGMS